MIQLTVMIDMLDCQRLQSEWKQLAEDSSASEGITRLGSCMSLEWAMTLWKTHLASGRICVMVAEEGGRVLAILPCHSHNDFSLFGRDFTP